MSDDLDAVRKYTKMLLAQFAAESYLDGLSGNLRDLVINTEEDYADPNTLTGCLALGPNDWNKGYGIDQDGNQNEKPRWSATLSTKGMLDQFAGNWIVVDQQSNTSSGFSATLLKDKDTGEFHIAFRSTESKSSADGGDVLRDSSNGANGEIGNEGFAWAQIMDMEKYFAGLLEGKLASKGNEIDDQFKNEFQEKNFKITVSGYSLKI